jgi:lipopolysaccharide biosynthesis glycosyltransferase
MHIVSAADEAFVPHFCAMLHSAWLFQPQAAYTLIAYRIEESTAQKLHRFAADRRIKLDIVPLDPRLVEGLPTVPSLTAATYARLFIAELLPETIGRAIYLDADITLNGVLDGLFELDMQSMPLAAAPDIEETSATERQLLGLPADACYFNSGVLLADLVMWRRENIGETIRTYARTTATPLVQFDQSAINVVLEGRILRIPRTFNAFASSHLEEETDPVVLHHAAVKPWQAEWCAFHDLYSFHRNNTPWPLGKSGGAASDFKQLRRELAALFGIPRYRSLMNRIRPQQAMRRTIGLPALERARARHADMVVAQGIA